MSDKQSNLSDPRYDYDLVIAMTERSVNTGLKIFLDSNPFAEVKVCFVIQEHKWVLIPYEELKKRAKGSCPFKPRDGANPDKDPDLINLKNAHYAGGFLAQIGFPDMEDPKSLNIVTLKGGTNSANFNLVCSEFQITGFMYDGEGASWINQSQPDKILAGKMPWYFSADVQLGNMVVDAHSPQLPKAVQAKVGSLQAGSFSIRQMFLDLDTAVETARDLTLKGVDSSSALYIELTAVFVKHYVEEMKKSGQPILGYAVTMNKPDEGTMHLGAVSREFCALLDPNGNPYAKPTRDQQELTTFNYLCTTKTVPPTAKPFGWNWVELTDVDHISGVQAFRRSSFGSILRSAFASVLDPRFCLTTGFRFESGHTDNKIYPNWSFGSPGHCTFEASPPPQSPVPPQKFAELLRFSYENKEYQDSGYVGPWGGKIRLEVRANYSFKGTVSIGVNKDAVPCIRLAMEAVLQMGMQYWEMANLTPYNPLDLDNYVNYSVVVDMPMKADSSRARLIVEPGKPTIQNTSKDPEAAYRGGGLIGQDVHRLMKIYLKKIAGYEDNLIKSGFEYISEAIAAAMNGANGFVFPGGKVFAFQNVSLSDYQDLIIHISYLEAK